MSSSPGNETDPTAQDQPAAEDPEKRASASSDEPIDCPNCGRTFSGSYCPGCGQKAGQAVTIQEIAGDAFREVVDVEAGFRATVVGLTLRPGEVLQKYLSGARKQFMSPGRYLTVAVLLYLGTVQAFSWLGLRQDFAEVFTDPTDGNTDFVEFMDAVGQMTQSQWYVLAVTLLSAGILGLVFRRLFSAKLARTAEALALGVFLTSHAAILSTGAKLLLVPATYFWTGSPANPVVLSSVSVLITILYPGVAVHRCFGTGWKSAVKGVLGAFWAYIEAVGVGSILIVWYLVWRLPNFPGETGGDGGEPFHVVMGVISVVYLLPLLIHAGVEAYYRWR